jgi:hypothetical protein
MSENCSKLWYISTSRELLSWVSGKALSAALYELVVAFAAVSRTGPGHDKSAPDGCPVVSTGP